VRLQFNEIIISNGLYEIEDETSNIEINPHLEDHLSKFRNIEYSKQINNSKNLKEKFLNVINKKIFRIFGVSLIEINSKKLKRTFIFKEKIKYLIKLNKKVKHFSKLAKMKKSLTEQGKLDVKPDVDKKKLNVKPNNRNKKSLKVKHKEKVKQNLSNSLLANINTKLLKKSRLNKKFLKKGDLQSGKIRKKSESIKFAIKKFTLDNRAQRKPLLNTKSKKQSLDYLLIIEQWLIKYYNIKNQLKKQKFKFVGEKLVIAKPKDIRDVIIEQQQTQQQQTQQQQTQQQQIQDYIKTQYQQTQTVKPKSIPYSYMEYLKTQLKNQENLYKDIKQYWVKEFKPIIVFTDIFIQKNTFLYKIFENLIICIKPNFIPKIQKFLNFLDDSVNKFITRHKKFKYFVDKANEKKKALDFSKYLIIERLHIVYKYLRVLFNFIKSIFKFIFFSVKFLYKIIFKYPILMLKFVKTQFILYKLYREDIEKKKKEISLIIEKEKLDKIRNIIKSLKNKTHIRRVKKVAKLHVKSKK
jgi:hypothetical protein